MRKFTVITLGLALLLLVLPGRLTAQSQNAADALLVNFGSELWRSAEPLATTEADVVAGCSGNAESSLGPLVLSPTGRFVAYMGYAPGMEAVLEAGWGGPVPAELWLCDVQSFTETRIYAQPDGFNPGTNADAPVLFDIVSTPAWAPDGNRLAFSTLSTGDDLPRLRVYDVAADNSGTINDSLPRPAGVPRPPALQWGNTGIVAISNTIANETATYQIDVYDDNGSNIDSQIIPNIAEQGAPVEHLIAQRGAEEIVVIPHVSGTIDYYNLTARLFEAASGVIQYSVIDSGVRLFYLPNGGVQGATWEAEFPNGSRVLLPYTELASAGSIAISPSGQSLAMYGGPDIDIWQGGAIVGQMMIVADGSLPVTTRVVWGAGDWQIIEGGFGG